MKNKYLKIIVAIGTLLLIILSVVFLQKEQAIESVEKTTQIVETSKLPAKKPEKPEVKKEELKKPDNVTQEFWNRTLEIHKMIKDANGPIAFYGKIIDQNNESVPGMKVTIEISRKNESFKEYFGGGKQNITNNFEVFSDINGKFELTGKYGVGEHRVPNGNN